MLVSNKQKVIKGMSSQTLVTVGLGIVEIVYFSIMSRLLSREDFGLFAAISAITVIFYSISEAGIGSALIQRKEMTEEYKNTAFTLSLITGGIVSVIMVVLATPLAKLVVGEHLRVPLMLMATTIFLNGMISVTISWMHRYLRFLTAGFVRLVALLAASIIAIIMALYGYGFYAILTKVIAASLFTLILSLFFVKTSFRLQLKKEYMKSIVNFGGWLTASVIVHNISSQIDRLLMSRLLSVESLGAYNRPKEFILQIGTRINGIFDSALFPVLSGIQDQKDSLRNAFNRSQYYMNICSMGLALAFICNSELIIRVFFGYEWLDLKPVFQVISFSLIFNINGRLGDCYLRSLGLVRQQFNLRSIELILNIVCILIGFHFGILGVAIGFLLANITLIAIKTMYLAVKLGIPHKALLCNVVGGWAYGIYFLPLVISQYFWIPETIAGCICSLIIFLVLLLLLFVCLPNLIGKKYKEEIYTKMKTTFFCKFHP